MRSLFGIILILLLGILFGWILFWPGCLHLFSGTYDTPKEVNVVADSTYVYHLEASQKNTQVSISKHESVVWTFDADSTVDSVTAVFTSGTPFASARFSFGDSAAFSGLPVVPAGHINYQYTITVYPHSHAPVTVDPGIIIVI